MKSTDAKDENKGKEDEIKSVDGSDEEYTKILLTKTHKIQEGEDPQDFEDNMAGYAERLVKRSMKRGDIKGVQDINNNKMITDLSDYNLWLSEPRMIGKKTISVEIYFAVETSMRLWEIIE